MEVMAIVAMGAGIASSIGSAVVGAQAAQYQGEAQAQQANYQARVAQINADIAKKNAAYQLQVGEVEAQQSGLRSRYAQGLTRAMQGRAGLDIGYGTTAAVGASQRMVGRHEQQIIRSNAAQRAYGHEVAAFQETAKGELYRASAQNARAAAEFGVATSYLGGISSVSSKWMQGYQVGAFNSFGSAVSPLFGA